MALVDRLDLERLLAACEMDVVLLHPDHQREQRQEPAAQPRRQRAVGGQQQPGDDQARPECGDPGGQVRPQRQLRDKDERSEPEELRAREWRGRCGREDHGALSRGKSASAVSAARR